MGMNNKDGLPQPQRGQRLAKQLQEKIQRAEREKIYGRTTLEIVWVEGRIKTAEFTDMVSEKFE